MNTSSSDEGESVFADTSSAASAVLFILGANSADSVDQVFSISGAFANFGHGVEFGVSWANWEWFTSVA